MISPDEYRNSFRDCNPGQRRIIMYNHPWCKCAINNLRNGKMIDGFKIFLSGQHGTYKSSIIKLICRDVIYFFPTNYETKTQ